MSVGVTLVIVIMVVAIAASVLFGMLANASTCTSTGLNYIHINFFKFLFEFLDIGLAGVEGNLNTLGSNIHNAILHTLLEGDYVENLLCAILAIQVGCKLHNLGFLHFFLLSNRDTHTHSERKHKNQKSLHNFLII